ncbi:MAG: NADPH:quinone reductase [Armatimonadota bacterium]
MQAIRIHAFGGPDVLALESVDDPIPGAGEVRIRVHAIGVNPVETYVRNGAYGPRAFPFTPGTDCAGVVDAVGDGVETFRIGDRVYTSGTITGAYAEAAVATVAHVHRLPDPLDFAEGAAIGIPYATAWRALVDIAAARPGESLLIHGASGGVGVAALGIARHLGLRTTGSAGSDAGEALIGTLGVDHAVRHDRDGYLAGAVAATPEGAGFDIVLEMAAHRNLGADLGILRLGGRVVVVGSRGPIEVNARELMIRDASVHGMLLFNAPPTELARTHADLGRCFTNGDFRPVIARRFPLADAAKAHRAVLEPGAVGKLVLVP